MKKSQMSYAFVFPLTLTTLDKNHSKQLFAPKRLYMGNGSSDDAMHILFTRKWMR